MEDYLLKQLEDGAIDYEEKMVDRQVLEINDINNGGYNGTINMNLSSWSTNDLFVDYSNATIQIPVILKAVPPAAAGIAVVDASAYMIGLKNCYVNFIDSLTVSYNGRNVVEQQAFTNFHANFRLLTSMSQDDVNKWGASIGFYKDDVSGYTYSIAATANGGNGFQNNVDEDNAVVDIVDRKRNGKSNNGFTERKKLTTAYDPTSQLLLAGAASSADGLYGMNTFTKVDINTMVWEMVITIRLKDISPFFESAGLLRNANINMSITYNSAETVITNPLINVMSATVTQKSGNTNPVLVTSQASAASGPTFGALDLVTTITTKIGTDGVYSVKSLSNSARMYASAYTPSTKTNQLIMSRFPSKKISYNDIYTYKITNKTGAFTEIVSNGISGLQYVVVIPVAALALSQYQSPFDTCPGTTCPLATIDNFQIQVGGRNMFQKGFQYSYENFLFELASINAKHGGACTGDVSGLLSQHDFNFGYRYYVCDLSRRASYENNKPQSVAVLGTNATKIANITIPMDYIVIVAYNKSIVVDNVTGALIG